MVDNGLNEESSANRLNRMTAEFRKEVHQSLAGLRLQILALLVFSLLGTVVNVVLAFWKRTTAGPERSGVGSALTRSGGY